MRTPSLRFPVRLPTLLVLASALAFSSSCPAADPAAQASWPDAGRVVAFADVHGAYDELVGLLQAASVVDKSLHWSAGRTHVVSLGDMLDRGSDSRKVMDLLMRLQGEAVAAGGQLHVVLGNHEAMNLLGDLRYVSTGEYAAFAGEETKGVREQRRADWISANGPDAGTAFDQKFPPGYFAQRAAFAPTGKYGQWLLGLPAVISLNDTLFMHAGPSNVLRGMALAEIDTRYRSALVEYLGALDGLTSAGLLREGDSFEQRPGIAAERLAAMGTADEATRSRLSAALQRFKTADDSPMLNVDGPNWYRGAALCNECAEADVLQPILDGLGLHRLVVGHTVARDGRVATRLGGKVVKLDAGMNRAVYHGHPAALILDSSKTEVLYAEAPGTPAAVPAEALRVAPSSLDDATVADALATGTVTVSGPRAPGTLDVSIEKGAVHFPAVFVQAGEDASNHELAAYRLDRLLQLGIVPATVAREVQGQRGYLQARPEKWVTQADVQKQSLRANGWCPLDPQFELIYAFDALAGNEGRTAERVLLDSQEWTVFSTGHDRAFGTGKAFPAYLKARAPAPGAELRRRIKALDDAALASALGNLVDARARKALLERRDALLALPQAAAVGR